MQRYFYWMTLPGMIVAGLLGEASTPLLGFLGALVLLIVGLLIWIRLDL